MSCASTKCKNPNCNNILKACKLINGLCPTCHYIEQERLRQEALSKIQQNTNP